MPGAIPLKLVAEDLPAQIICEYLLVPQSAVFNKSVPNISAIRDQQHQIQISGIIIILIILPLFD